MDKAEKINYVFELIKEKQIDIDDVITWIQENLSNCQSENRTSA